MRPQKGTVTARFKTHDDRRNPSEATEPNNQQSGAGLLALLEVEREAREARDHKELYYVISNQTPKLTGARQAFVFEATSPKRLRLVSITGLAAIDRTVPLIQTMEKLAVGALGKHKDNAPLAFATTEFPRENAELKHVYPFRTMCWIPFKCRNNDLLGGMLLARETTWGEADHVVAARLGHAFAHSWSALLTARRYKKPQTKNRRLTSLFGIIALLSLAIPVPMTTLAPMEIVPANPFIVAASIDGVLDDIFVEPNAMVKRGDLLLRFDNTTLKNQLELAEREVLVAGARLKRATQLAFSDQRGRHDLAISRAELDLKTAERDYARDMLSKSEIKAEREGIAVFADKNDLVGKPVAVGERIMQIADPAQIKVRIEVPVSDSIILKEGAPVTLYLDATPLQSLAATIVHADFQATIKAQGALAFGAVAKIDDADEPPPRFGVRGTAQIFGDKVSLGFYLFRKPISALRQWIGA